ncbi:MAG: hypothetical protein BAJALOKI3v1_190042 [Promethearchaeota archaeon]|nr:MAG: hypothetical protein BAJALOKI3v1_190042 [Candidatus Lokiarchaeota archaeon]
MSLKPKLILENFNSGKISKEFAIKTLIFLIIESKNDLVRFDSIEILGTIGSNHKSLFLLFEVILISDSNEKIRIAAFNILKKCFPIKAIKPISHAIEWENGDLLIFLIEFLEEIRFPKRRELLIKKIKTLNKRYLNFIVMDANLGNLRYTELKEIILNYLMYMSFESLYFHRHKIPLALDFYDFNFISNKKIFSKFENIE